MIEHWLANEIIKPVKKVDDYLTTESESFERFAWLPKKMSNNKRIWLRKYIEVRYYVDLFGRPPLRNNYYSAYFTPKDYTLFLLKGSKTSANRALEFTGVPHHKQYKSVYKRWLILKE